MEHICVFGDSTAWGAWDREKGGWVNRLWLHAAPNYYPSIYNLSISGGTTEMILSRFESEARYREADGLIFQTGGNDASRENGRGLRIPPEEFRGNLEKIIEAARRITPNILFIGFTNCDESKTAPVSWCDFHYLNADIQAYNAIMKTVCADRDVPFLDVFGLLAEDDFEDGLHPNGAGHEKLFVRIRDFLREQKWIP